MLRILEHLWCSFAGEVKESQYVIFMTKSPLCHPCFCSVCNCESRKNIIIFHFGYTFILYICNKLILNVVRTGTAENGGFPGGTSGEESICQCRRRNRPGLDSRVWKTPEEGNGNPPQYSCLGSLMDRRVWRATARGVSKEPDTTEHTHGGQQKVENICALQSG